MASTLPNPVLLEQAIRSRLILSMAHADIGVTVQGVAAHMAGSVFQAKHGSSPYIVFDLLSGDFNGVFAADGISALYRVTIHDHPENGGVDAAKAFEGIWGNWHPTDNTTPDYGLHMWEPSAAGMTPCTMIAKRWATPHTPDVLNYQITFEAKSFNEE